VPPYQQEGTCASLLNHCCFLPAVPHAALQAASCSFPRIDGSRFGVPPNAHPGDKVLHLACGNGALTKLLFSSGLQVTGVQRGGLGVGCWIGVLKSMVGRHLC